jgi:hypothetical protein
MYLSCANWRGVILDQTRVGNAISDGLPIGVDGAPEKFEQDGDRRATVNPKKRPEG